MLLNAQKLTSDVLDAGIVIVGAGPAGIALALALGARGRDCLLLEAGGGALDPAAQELYRASTIAPADHGPVHLYRRRALGGTSAIWGGRCIPFDPIDFEDRPWIPEATWPISHEQVSGYYAAALDLCRAGPAQFSAGEALPSSPAPMVDGVDDARVILDRIERFSEPTDFGRAYLSRLTASAKVRLLMHANVIEVLADPMGRRATGVLIALPGGRRLTVRAQTVVLANGALETPRLLLASQTAKGCGLGNERDLVGRYYQSHLEGEVGEITFKRPSREVRLDYERSAEGIYCRRYVWLSPKAQRDHKLGGLIVRPHHPKIADPDHRNPVLSAMFLVKDLVVPEYGRKMTSTEHATLAGATESRSSLYRRHMVNVVLGSPRLMHFAMDWVRRRNLAKRKLPSVVLRDPRNKYLLDVNAEQTPNFYSRVSLAQDVDALGMPRLAIDWRTTGQDRAMLAGGLRLLKQAFDASGTADIHIESDDAEAEAARCTRIGGHHIGTARMAASPDKGVVDGDGQCFDVKGLFVVGAATFPTSGFANPTLTLVALALRMADHLAQREPSRVLAA